MAEAAQKLENKAPEKQPDPESMSMTELVETGKDSFMFLENALKNQTSDAPVTDGSSDTKPGEAADNAAKPDQEEASDGDDPVGAKADGAADEDGKGEDASASKKPDLSKRKQKLQNRIAKLTAEKKQAQADNTKLKQELDSIKSKAPEGEESEEGDKDDGESDPDASLKDGSGDEDADNEGPDIEEYLEKFPDDFNKAYQEWHKEATIHFNKNQGEEPKNPEKEPDATKKNKADKEEGSDEQSASGLAYQHFHEALEEAFPSDSEEGDDILNEFVEKTQEGKIFINADLLDIVNYDLNSDEIKKVVELYNKSPRLSFSIGALGKGKIMERIKVLHKARFDNPKSKPGTKNPSEKNELDIDQLIGKSGVDLDINNTAHAEKMLLTGQFVDFEKQINGRT